VSFQHSALESGAPATRANQRATVRYQCAPATSGRVVLTADLEFQRAWVLDLSLQGVGLSMSRPVKAGTALVIQLKSSSNQKSYELSALVVHATATPAGDFRVGCEFIRAITAEDLDALL
jgi:hypothetical protein